MTMDNRRGRMLSALGQQDLSLTTEEGKQLMLLRGREVLLHKLSQECRKIECLKNGTFSRILLLGRGVPGLSSSKRLLKWPNFLQSSQIFQPYLIAETVAASKPL